MVWIGLCADYHVKAGLIAISRVDMTDDFQRMARHHLHFFDPPMTVGDAGIAVFRSANRSARTSACNLSTAVPFLERARRTVRNVRASSSDIWRVMFISSSPLLVDWAVA